MEKYKFVFVNIYNISICFVFYNIVEKLKLDF